MSSDEYKFLQIIEDKDWSCLDEIYTGAKYRSYREINTRRSRAEWGTNDKNTT